MNNTLIHSKINQKEVWFVVSEMQSGRYWEAYENIRDDHNAIIVHSLLLISSRSHFLPSWDVADLTV